MWIYRIKYREVRRTRSERDLAEWVDQCVLTWFGYVDRIL